MPQQPWTNRFLLVMGLLALTGCRFSTNSGDLTGSESVSISIRDASLAETDVASETFSQAIAIELSVPAYYQFTLDYEFSDVYITDDANFSVEDGTLTIAKGATVAYIPVEVLGDNEGEGDDVFKVTLSNSALGEFADQEATITIVEDDPLVLSVAAMFPTNGADWNDYISLDESKPLIEQADAACAGSAFLPCLHAAPIKKVIAIGQPTCDGLELEDQLGVFSWECSESEDPVFFYSTGLKDGKGLADLVTTNAFLSNNVVLDKSGEEIGASAASTTWWTNAFQPVTLNSGGGDPLYSLNSAGTIYTVNGSGSSRGIEITAANVALVLLSGSTVSSTTAQAGDCDPNGGGETCLVFSKTNSMNYVWIEGSFVGHSSLQAVISLRHTFGGASTFSYLRNVTVDAQSAVNGVEIYRMSRGTIVGGEIFGAQDGILIESQSRGWTISDVDLYSHTSDGIEIGNQANEGVYSDIRAVNNGAMGINNQAWNGQFIRVVASNNTAQGAQIVGYENVIVESLFAGNGSDGIDVDNYGNMLNGVTAVNNGGSGIKIRGFNDLLTSYVFNSISANNAIGLDVQRDDVVFRNLQVTDNDVGISFDDSTTGGSFSESLILGNTTNCDYPSAGANPGLTGANCDNEAGFSSATRTLGYSSNDDFLGKVTSDNSNTHSTGLVAFASLTDWVRFDDIFRAWGIEVAAYPDVTQRGECAAGNCRIWDWRLSGNATHASDINGTPVAGEACPEELDGDVIFDPSADSLINAYEASDILGSGDADGWCEDGEICNIVRNLGADQSRSNSFSTCTFVDGTLTGITLRF